MQQTDGILVSNKIQIEDLPKTITGSLSRSNTIVLCDRCKGFGFVLDEELSDYHKREYTTTRSKCLRCEGDGRLIKSTEHLSLNIGNDKVTFMPYISFKDFVDPHGYEDRWLRMRLDLTDRQLEEKYPELKAVNYDNYDKLVEHYRTIELLKKDHNNG
jgi:hypothetical protein